MARGCGLGQHNDGAARLSTIWADQIRSVTMQTGDGGSRPDSGSGPNPGSGPGPGSGVRPRRRDRHGRGLRGPLVPPGIPLYRTRSQQFDDLVLEAVARLEPRWETELSEERRVGKECRSRWSPY